MLKSLSAVCSSRRNLRQALTVSAVVACLLAVRSLSQAAAPQSAEQADAALRAVRAKVLAPQIRAEALRKALTEAGVRLGTWHRIGPFRDQGPLLNWMDNVASSFAHAFDVEKDVKAGGNAIRLTKPYPAPNFPIDPTAVRRWTPHTEWIDGYYQELPRGPAPSAGETQYIYRTLTAGSPVEVEIDFVLRAPEADRRMGEKGMEHWRRTGRYAWSVNGKEIQRWEGRGDMPRPVMVKLNKGTNHFWAKLTNNRQAYGFAFTITGLSPSLRREKGFEGLWRPLEIDRITDVPYCVQNPASSKKLSLVERYEASLQRLAALKFHPEPMPGVETAVRDSQGRIVPAMEKALAKYPTSPEGRRHAARLAELEKTVRPLLAKILTTGEPMCSEVLAAADALDGVWSRTIRELPPLVFLERETYRNDAMQFTGTGAGSARIRTFNPESGTLATLYEMGNARAHEINLSWDAKTIYIGGGGRIMAVGSDGKNFRVLHRGQSPCEMPDGRVVFFDDDVGQSPCKGGGPRRLLFICDADGANRKMVSANLTIDNSPTIMNDGRVIFARWDYGVNKNVFNRHAIWVQNPDGTAIDLYFGNTVIDPRAFYKPRHVPGRPEVMCVFGPHHGNTAGLVGLMWNGQGKETPDGLGFRRLTHDTASVGDRPPQYAYQDPYPLNEQLFLASYGGTCTSKGRRDASAGLYLIDRAGNKKCVIGPAGKRGVHSAQPFVARKRPPVIPDRTTTPNWVRGVDLHQRLLTDPDWTQKSTLVMEDVYQGIEPEIKRGQVKYLAVMEQVTHSHGRGGAIGVGTIWYVNRCVGLVPVEDDGSAKFEVPALRSLYFHVLDKDGQMLMTQGSDFHTMPGEVRSCIGCHEQRKGITASKTRKLSIAARKAPVRPRMPKWGTNGIIEYEAVVQPVLDKYCVRCHSGPRPKSNLNLTGARTTVYNMSYMELTDRMLVHFQPGTGRTHAQPTNDCDEQAPLSRGSLLSKMARHVRDPKHSKKAIPFEDQLKIFLWIDSNVPYYSHYRQKSPTHLAGAARKALADVHRRRCVTCHTGLDRPDAKSGLNRNHVAVHVGGNKPGDWGVADSGMRVRHMNLSEPTHSAAAQAPLAKAAGGWDLCKGAGGKAIFADKTDPDYLKILSALKQIDRRDKAPDYIGVAEILKKAAPGGAPVAGGK